MATNTNGYQVTSTSWTAINNAGANVTVQVTGDNPVFCFIASSAPTGVPDGKLILKPLEVYAITAQAGEHVYIKGLFSYPTQVSVSDA